MINVEKGGFLYFREFVKDNKIHIDMRETEYNFLFHLFNYLKPKDILCLGGYTNFDAIFCSKKLTDCSIVNIDNLDDQYIWRLPILPIEKEVIKKQKLIIQKTNYKGKYKWIREAIKEDKIFEKHWDIIWDGRTNHIINDIPKDTVYIKYTYSNPKTLLEVLPEIDKNIPLVVLGKSIAIFGNLKKFYKQKEINELLKDSVHWKFNNKRKIPIIWSTYLSRSGNKQDWKNYLM